MVTCMPGESYCRRLRSLLLCSWDIFQVLINSLVHWLCTTCNWYHLPLFFLFPGCTQCRLMQPAHFLPASHTAWWARTRTTNKNILKKEQGRLRLFPVQNCADWNRTLAESVHATCPVTLNPSTSLFFLHTNTYALRCLNGVQAENCCIWITHFHGQWRGGFMFFYSDHIYLYQLGFVHIYIPTWDSYLICNVQAAAKVTSVLHKTDQITGVSLTHCS